MIARKTLLHFLNTLLGAIFGVVALKLIALYMGDTVLGQVAYAIGLLTLLHGILKLNLQNAHEKRLGEGTREADKIATFAWVQLGLAAAFALIVAGFLTVWVVVLGKGFRSTTLLVMIIVTVFLIGKNLRHVSVNTFNGQREIARSQTVTILDDVLRIGSTIVVAVLYGAAVKSKGPLAGWVGGAAWWEAFGPEVLAITYLLGAAGSGLIGLAYMLRVHPIGDFDRGILASYWDYARPLFAVNIISTMANNLDRAMIGYFWTGAAVGLYFGMDRIVNFIVSITFALGTVLIPAISHMAEEDDRQGIGDVTSRSHRYTAMVVLPMVLFILVFAEEIIHLILSDEFLRGAPVLMALAAYTFFFVSYRPYQSAVLGLDRPKASAKVSAVALMFNIGLNVVLIPEDIQSLGIDLVGLGPLGAAIATLTSGVVGYVGFRMLAGRLLPLRDQWPHLVRQLAAGSVMIAVLYVLDSLVVGLARWFHLLAFGLGGLAIYVATMHVLGEFDEDDLRFFLDMVHPGEMWDYIKTELFHVDDEDDEP